MFAAVRHPGRHAVITALMIGGGLAASAAHATEYAQVVSATPVTASVPRARQVCSDGQQVVQARPSGVGAVIGAIAGGVIGHNLGNGYGRAAATGIGAIAGAVVGDQVEANTAPVAEVPVRRCQTVTSYENRIVGYDVMYDYAGQRYSTRMARDPGRQFAVSVQPAEGAVAVPAGAALPAPAEVDLEPIASAPSTVYYANAPQTVYYAPVPPAVYVAPVIGFGIGYYGGYYGRGRYRWH